MLELEIRDQEEPKKAVHSNTRHYNALIYHCLYFGNYLYLLFVEKHRCHQLKEGCVRRLLLARLRGFPRTLKGRQTEFVFMLRSSTTHARHLKRGRAVSQTQKGAGCLASPPAAFSLLTPTRSSVSLFSSKQRTGWPAVVTHTYCFCTSRESSLVYLAMIIVHGVWISSRILSCSLHMEIFR